MRRSRLSTAVRGYTGPYLAIRRSVAEVVVGGNARCWRCGKPIEPTAKWHLGHDDWDRSVIRGPEHAFCNLSAAGRKSQGSRARKVSVAL